MMLEIAMKRWEEFKNAGKIQRPCCSLSGRPTITYNVPGEIIFVKGDSLRLPFFDNSFDAITIGYGLRNLSDWKLAIAEMIRVAKPGGKIVILEFGKPELKLWRLIYFWYLKNIIPWLGKFTAGDFDAYYYIYESLMRYPGQFLVADEMSRAGCRNTQIINILGGAMTINYGEKS
jgi:demethylmenaquinone methyltransferase/2-methoxy-6-polyprenyl-1,4-benzoquinol methylase